MPDISMCSNETCPIRYTCYRHMAEPSPWQSYSRFLYTPFYTHDNAIQIKCNFFLEVTSLDKLRKIL